MDQNKLRNWLQVRKNRKEQYDYTNLFNLIQKGDIGALARGITLIESTKEEDQKAAQNLIQSSLPFTGKSLRIGITGVPGVGKSTFIEAFGKQLIESGKKVAVLAIDPSSEKTHGSILGDKTRMVELASNPKAFIRPSPAGDFLGGVARKTRESIYLCELAGFDIILIETVGVGQSETVVHSMVDFFLLLVLAGAGDELQGMKRGIIEMADLLVITKADGENIKKANLAKQSYQNALHLFPTNSNNWIPKVLTCSSFNKNDIQLIIDIIFDFQKAMLSNSYLSENRKKQNLYWFDEFLKNFIVNYFYNDDAFKKNVTFYKKLVLNGKMGSFEAAQMISKLHKITN